MNSKGRLYSYHRHDIEILEKHFDLKVVRWSRKFTMSVPEIISLLRHGRDADFIISFFPQFHSVVSSILAKTLNIPHFIVYGIAPKEEKSLMVKLTDFLFLNDSKQIKELSNAFGISEDKMIVVHREFDYNYFTGNEKKERFVLSVGNNYHRKGIDRIIAVAENLPDVRFVVIGLKKPFDEIPSNIEFKGLVPQNELLEYYKKAKVYLQLTRWDAVPNALIEAMLCECIPIATRDGLWGCGWDLPFDISGYVIDKKQFNDTDYLCRIVKESIDSENNERKLNEARKECIKRFGTPIREKNLVEAIKSKIKE
ncbi:MAG: glycosyltransferase family 4 protein [Candidatus Thermoplasmatota archaeon]